MNLAATLRRSASAPPAKELDVSAVEAAVEHGVAPLLYRVLKDAGVWGELEGAVQERLGRIAREAVATDAVRADDLREVIAALASAGVHPLLFKGAALAATHYSEPWLRPRGDSDLLVRREDAARAGEVLEVRGFRRLSRPGGELVTQQARYEGRRHGVPLAYDVHWRAADPHAFADALPYSELEREAVNDHPSGARRLSAVHALAVACVHRAAHHYDAPTLILQHDIHLITGRLTADEWGRFVEWAVRRRMCAVSLRGLRLAADSFGASPPDAVMQRLARAASGEPSARYVASSGSPVRLRRVDLLVSDLKALSGVRARAALLCQHLFPDRDYMAVGQSPYSHAPRYLGRIVRGMAEWWRPL